MGERAWLDGFDGTNDRGVFFAASLRDHSIYLVKWKSAPVRAAMPQVTSVPASLGTADTVPLDVGVQSTEQGVTSLAVHSDDDEYVMLSELSDLSSDHNKGQRSSAHQTLFNETVTKTLHASTRPANPHGSLASQIFDLPLGGELPPLSVSGDKNPRRSPMSTKCTGGETSFEYDRCSSADHTHSNGSNVTDESNATI